MNEGRFAFTTFQDARGEEFLGEVFCLLMAVAPPADKTINRRPILLAKFRHSSGSRVVRNVELLDGVDDLSPLCGGEIPSCALVIRLTHIGIREQSAKSAIPTQAIYCVEKWSLAGGGLECSLSG